jgi:glucose-6-phosphate dehydrogenase assembly protein OpcA
MASALVERAWRDTTPEGVEDDLAALWRDLAGRGAITRAVMSNLVVFRFHERRSNRGRVSGGAGSDAHEAVMALHPSRTIVIEHDRGHHDPQEPIGAAVGVSVFGPPTARYGVEQVLVKSACAEVSLPSVVRRFIRGDLPTSVWWTEDLSRWPPLDALVETGRQLVYDSRAWLDMDAGFRTLAPLTAGRRIDLADLNWRRLAPLRRALLHAVAGITAPGHAPIRITYRPGERALAWLLAGWLAARLRWTRGGWSPVEESPDSADLLTLTIGGGSESLVATLDDHRVLVQQPGIAPMTLPTPRDTDAEAIAAELRSLSYDAALHEAIVAVASRGVQ